MLRRCVAGDVGTKLFGEYGDRNSVVRCSHLTSSLVAHSCSCVEPGGEVGAGNGASGQSSIETGCGLALF